MSIVLKTPSDGERIVLLPEAMRLLRAGGMTVGDADGALDWRNPKLDGTERSQPLPVTFSWDGADRAVLHLSLTPDFSDETVIEAENGSVDVSNFLIGARFYWRVSAGAETSKARFFDTDAQAPRLIRAEGLTNIRDAGGWVTAEGKTVRQGLFYRGSEMDTHHTLTDESKDVLRGTLRIRTDLDLRGEAVGRVGESPLGPDVRFELIPISAYGAFFETEKMSACRAVFALLARREVYPVYAHCWGGADRTGTLALLLGALLGMDDESLMQDYELTSFAIWGKRSRTSDLFVSLIDALNRYGGPEEPMRVKAVRYLLETGVTQAQIDAIRRIFLD